LRRIAYFGPGSKVSHLKSQILIDAERKLGMIDGSLMVDRLVMPIATEMMD
jgi:hypothetical protein